MSDMEESFTILGTSPTPSMEQRINDESSMGLGHIIASSENCKLSHTTPTTPAQSIQFADGEVALQQCLSVDNSAIGKLEASANKMDTSMPIEVTVYEDLIQKLKTENEQLKEIIRDAAEQTNHTAALEKELSELQEQIKIERDAGYAEVFELNKQLSEKESIVKNQTYMIERLEEEKLELVKVKSKIHGGECAQHITQEDYDRQIKALRQEMSVVEAKKSELEILLSECKNQLKCLEDDQKVTQAMLKKNRTQIANHQKEMEAKNVEIKDLVDEIVLLKSRSEMDLYGSYEGRTTVDLPLTASVLADHNSDDRAILICPLCDDKSYKDLGALQEHVEACIMVEVVN